MKFIKVTEKLLQFYPLNLISNKIILCILFLKIILLCKFVKNFVHIIGQFFDLYAAKLTLASKF